MPHFNPRSPCGERPKPLIHNEGIGTFQSTLPVRGATDRVRSELEKASISIHAPRAGSDFEPGDFKTRFRFQSTLPVRGATGSQHLIFVRNQISIHAPRAGSDCRSQCAHVSDWRFQSTLPVRGATRVSLQTLEQGRRISIHAPRAGSDGPGVRAAGASGISIHAPRAGSDEQGHPAQFCTGAISIHAPRAGSDSGSAGADDSHSISIHAPRAGSDSMATSKKSNLRGFQSTLPVRGATRFQPKTTSDI